MSNTGRLKAIMQGKAARAIDRMDDPRDALDDTYDREAEMLQQVRRGIADIATARKRVELQGQEEGARYARLGEQAREAIDQGREDLARIALERRTSVAAQVATLRVQFEGLERQQTRLQETEQRLRERLAAFRIEKETIKASYAASAAQVRVNEAVAGISGQFDQAAARLDHARERIAQMQARAAATDELLATNGIPDVTGRPDADLDRQLGSTTDRSAIDRELAALRERPGIDGDARGGAGSWLEIDGPR